MITVIAVEDELTSLSQLKAAISHVPDLELKACFETITEALTYLRTQGRVNLLLCDIELPGISGLDAVEVLKKHCDELVFVTGHGAYALSAYKKRIKAFLTKPVAAADLLAVVEDILHIGAEPHPLEIRLGKLWIYAPTEKSYTPVFPDQVTVLIQCKNDMLVYINGAAEPLVVRETTERAMATLQHLGLFLQVNPGAIVNMNAVTGAAPKRVCVDTIELEVTKTFLDDYNLFLTRHQFGKGNKLRG